VTTNTCDSGGLDGNCTPRQPVAREASPSPSKVPARGSSSSGSSGPPSLVQPGVNVRPNDYPFQETGSTFARKGSARDQYERQFQAANQDTTKEFKAKQKAAAEKAKNKNKKGSV
jgi:hypothetical protein